MKNKIDLIIALRGAEDSLQASHGFFKSDNYKKAEAFMVQTMTFIQEAQMLLQKQDFAQEAKDLIKDMENPNA